MPTGIIATEKKPRKLSEFWFKTKTGFVLILRSTT